jgi:sialate O-acetylesterase
LEQVDIAGETVVAQSARVAAPKAVRFGWNQLAIPNLANKDGLPASPFPTDKW